MTTMNRKNVTKLAASAFALGLATPAFAQSGTPIEIPGTPYVQFIEELDDIGGYRAIPNPNNEFSIPASSSPFGQCADISMPFDFDFYGDAVSTVSACSHGAISMVPGIRLTTNNWAPGGSPRFGTDTDGFIAPFWGSVYLNGSTGASFGWQIVGNAPTRHLAMEYTNMTDASSTFSCCRWELDAQVRLYEGLSGKIEIDYRLEDTGSASGLTASASSGMESLQGDQEIDFIGSTPSDTWNWSDLQRELDGKRLTFVQDPGVELVALLANAPEFAPLGAEYDVEVTVANLNVNNLGPFAISVEVSQSLNFPPDETTDITARDENGNPFTLTLPQYQTRTVDVPAVAPVALGEQRYYHRICVDSEDNIGEVNEDNNCVITENQTRYLPSRPDVTVDRVRIPVRTAAPEEILPVTISVSNIGSEPVTDMPLAVMLSGNPAISPQDSELGRTLVSLPAGESTDVELDVPLPSVINSGAYFIGAYADIDDEYEESNEANNGRAVIFELGIEGGNLEIITSRIPNPLVNETYSAQFTAVGGDGNYSWCVSSSSRCTDLPNNGLQLELGEGLVFGVCQTEGPETFTIRVESAGDSAEREYTLDCVDPEEPLTIVTRSVPDGIIGQEYAFGLIVTGGASAMPDNLTWSANNLPMGIDITETGVLAGTPVMPGTQVATVTVTDGTETDEQQLTINIRDNQNLLIEVEQLPTATLGEQYDAQIRASGGVGQIIFSQDGGTLPRGLVLNPDGSITGIPDQVGPFEFVVKAQDNPAAGLRAQDRNTFVINVVDDSQAFQVANDALPTAVLGEAYNAAIAAVGGVPPLLWEVEGALPTGLETIQTEGSEELIIRGTPENTDAGRFIVVTVTDALSRQAQKVLVIAVVEPGEDVPICPNPNDERCPDPSLEEDEGGCTAVAGGTSSGFVGMVLALGAILVVRRRRRG
jgi:hypothetical protein